MSLVVDANKFGASYMQKLGWSAGTGLGATGEGMTSHIKVSQKLDMLGIGAAHQADPNGIAWKQNKEYENLLRRLNTGGDTEETCTKVEGFARAGASVEVEMKGETRDIQATEEEDAEERKEKKKRRRSQREDLSDSEIPERKSKKEEKSEKKKKKKTKSDETVASPSDSLSEAPTPVAGSSSGSRTPVTGPP